MTGGIDLQPAFDHAGVESTDIDADVAWHIDGLGARMLRWGTHVGTGRRIAMLAIGGAKLELVEVAEATGVWAHTAYRVADVPAACERLVAAGATLVVKPFRIEAAKAESCLLRAAGGAAVQFVRYDPDSPDLG